VWCVGVLVLFGRFYEFCWVVVAGMVGFWGVLGRIWGSENGLKMEFLGSGVGAFSENGGFLGFWGINYRLFLGVKLGVLG